MAASEILFKSVLTDEAIINKILFIRKQNLMLHRELTEMYGVEARVLNQAVKRNMERFPMDFMFRLTKKVFENLNSQIVISSWGGVLKRPFAFAEQEVSMLSGVLNSPVAIQVPIQIIRVFAKM